MKRFMVIIATLVFVVSCSKSEEFGYQEAFSLTGYSSVESRTSFGGPTADKIPFLWSAGDYIWVGNSSSKPIAEAGESARFEWDNTPSVAMGNYTVFYNMTGSANAAKVLAVQSADGNLGNDGDFGTAVTDEFNVFALEHKTSYIWFDTTSDESLPKLTKITATAEEGISLAGQQVFDYQDDEWSAAVANGTNSVVLDFGEGVELKPENEGVFATMVTLPAAIGGTELTIVYTFADGSSYAEVKNPTKDLAPGKVQRVATTIKQSDLVKEPELRVLTFEDGTQQFERYTLDYCSTTVEEWSDLIAEYQMPGATELLYGPSYVYNNTEYWWCDAGNTALSHAFPEGSWGKAFSSGGIAISNYVYTGGLGAEDLSADLNATNSMYNYQLSVCSSRTANNFAVCYCDSTIGGEFCSELSFSDSVARVIDHCYINMPIPTYYSLKYGSGFSEAYDEDDWLKIVATGTKSDGTTSSVELTMAEGADDSKWVRDWTMWDLSSLGAVTKISLHMEEAQSVTYDGVVYYYCSPLFFAIDDITVRY